MNTGVELDLKDTVEQLKRGAAGLPACDHAAKLRGLINGYRIADR